MKDFTAIDQGRVLHRGPHFFIIKDAYPVSNGHLLIISNRVAANYFELNTDEVMGLHDAIVIAKRLIEETHSPDGYNIGMNCGQAAGQTVFHFHCHVIPRYTGDMEDPRGGIRHCVVGKGHYIPNALF
jgi:diadenosine tetraphosphate (Ap4A) HIT family hydrolase